MYTTGLKNNWHSQNHRLWLTYTVQTLNNTVYALYGNCTVLLTLYTTEHRSLYIHTYSHCTALNNYWSALYKLNNTVRGHMIKFYMRWIGSSTYSLQQTNFFCVKLISCTAIVSNNVVCNDRYFTIKLQITRIKEKIIWLSMRNNCKEEFRMKVFDKIAKFHFSQIKKIICNTYHLYTYVQGRRW